MLNAAAAAAAAAFPAEGREVIIGRKAGEAVMRGAHVFVPGTLAVSAGAQRAQHSGPAHRLACRLLLA